MITEQSVRYAHQHLLRACGARDFRSNPADQCFCRVEIKLEIRQYFLGYLER